MRNKAGILILCGITLVMLYKLAMADFPTSGRTALWEMGEQYKARWDDDATGNVLDLTNSSQQWTIPDHKSSYEVCAFGNTAYILCGTNPTAATTDGNHSRIVPEGGCTRTFKFDCVDSDADGACDARKCAFIAPSTVTGARIQFLRYDPTL